MVTPERKEDGLAALDVGLHPRRYRAVRGLLLNAFPPEERMPMPLLALGALRRNVRLVAFYDGDAFAGFVDACFAERMVYVLYLAASPKVRSCGYGSRMLDWVKAEAAGRPVALEVEPLDEAAPNVEQRISRMRFYGRNGFSDTGFVSIDGKCTYTVLSTLPAGAPFPVEDMRQACRAMFAPLFAQRIEPRG